ncbi:hypothetical protein H5087_16150 [Pseudoalteromonas sp. SR43-7]|uniref:DNA sulfur modification protein DndB n=1 Tax=Pseudoalteromonas sp. SR43-7 TaxID=2760939 RepID=UPI0015F8DC2F|nr:DNA sulfur modification protein DndB [Pseudoalteromonas sp. SR43-7]MBB1330882.1 hypothetical protein [Pseudoalteromonas sp. SR43-7]
MTFNDIFLDHGPQFDSAISGTFGSFHTENSYEVNYLLTSMNYQELNKLQVAAEAFDFSQVNFDEMIQREIDTKRVNEEIVGDYLEKDSNRALFFPPIIVSIVAFDDDDKPLHKYDSFDETIVDKGKYKQFTKIWDKHFQIEVPINDNSFDFYKPENTPEIKIHKNAVTLRFDSKLVKFVIIDGQHRFKALVTYMERYKEQRKFLNLPICVCFSPKAIASNGAEDILDTLRSMFVTINNKGKQVSGHYLDLLNDASLASQTVRILANSWKKSSDDPTKSYLQFIEWNQRSESKARRVNRPQSITTVSMLCESLKQSVFSENKERSNLHEILRLAENKAELEKHNGTHIYSITESSFDIEQKECLYNLIEKNVVPSLELLLTKPSVFKAKIDSYMGAIDEYNDKSKASESGYKRFITQLSKFSDVDKSIHTEESKKVSDRFNLEIANNEHLENYTRLVFNQAYLRLWSDILSSNTLFRDNIESFTGTYISALEVVGFNEKRKLFSKSRRFNNLLLYKARKPNTTKAGKESWYNLLAISLNNDEAKDVIKKWLLPFEKSDDALDNLNNIIKLATESFIDKTNEELLKDLSANWRIKDIPIPLRNEIEEIDKSNDIQKFKMKMVDISQAEFRDRMDQLSSVVGFDVEKVNDL